ncbi:MAG: TetR/AcrR family transcriptional regulator C-terminal domain-containing protein [Acidimicrobiales bacterium]
MTRRARSPGRPAALSRGQVVAAAIEVGLRDLTLQSVADRLGVSISGLYRYVDDRDHLVALAADEIAARFVMPTDHAPNAASYLVGIGHGVRNLALEYDGLGDFFGRTGTHSPNWLRVIERFLNDLVAFGLSAPDAVALGSSVANFATASVERQRHAELNAVDHRLTTSYIEAIPDQFGPGELPLLEQGHQFLADTKPDDYFTWMLESFVDGLLTNVANAPWRSRTAGHATGITEAPTRAGASSAPSCEQVVTDDRHDEGPAFDGQTLQLRGATRRP